MYSYLYYEKLLKSTNTNQSIITAQIVKKKTFFYKLLDTMQVVW